MAPSRRTARAAAASKAPPPAAAAAAAAGRRPTRQAGAAATLGGTTGSAASRARPRAGDGVDPSSSSAGRWKDGAGVASRGRGGSSSSTGSAAGSVDDHDDHDDRSAGAASESALVLQRQLREMRIEMEVAEHAQRRRKRRRRPDDARRRLHQEHLQAPAGGGDAEAEAEGSRGLPYKSPRLAQQALDRRDHARNLVDRDPSRRTRGSRAAESDQFLRESHVYYDRGRSGEEESDGEQDEKEEEGGEGDATSDQDGYSTSEAVDDEGSGGDDDDDEAGDEVDDEEEEGDGEDDAVDDDGGLLEEEDDDDDLGEEEELEDVDLMVDDDDLVDEDYGNDEDEGGDEGDGQEGIEVAAAVAAAAAAAAARPKRKPRRFRRGIGGAKARGASSSGGGGGGGNKLFRMRSFRSVRMAERHGDALASFARGDHREAVAKLQLVARDLPSAPQVYASLAMVHEEVLSELEKGPPPPPAGRGGGGDGDDRERLARWLAERMAAAKKAYGAYHIAALLCKRDYSFWVRAGDMAATVADLHSQFMAIAGAAAPPRGTAAAEAAGPPPEEAQREHHRAEKRRWLAEAKSDYKAADNIKPPGIDIPAKLAAVCAELGCLPEALTLLTDLKNRGRPPGGRRSEFESSHKAWLLYADLMLRIGYECSRWNGGDQTIGNVSTRRWLRRHSTTFDWEERRLQALGKALEAAAGSASCRRVTDWLRRRARTATGARSSDSIGPNVAADAEDPFEGEKALLLEKNLKELADFDTTTDELDSESGGVPAAQRKAARSRLVASHDCALRELEREFGRSGGEPAERSDSLLESAEAPSLQGGDDGPPLAVSASTKTVCAIASELMKHLLLLKSYDGGTLVGEAVAFYLKHRADLHGRRARLRRRSDEAQSLLDSVLRVEPTERVEADVSDSDSVGALSDEDDLDFGGPHVVESMRRGLLPSDLNVLLSVCLLGQRGRDFVAFKCLQSIDSTEQESISYLQESEVDAGVSYDFTWTVFKRLRTGTLRRTEAFSLVQRALRDCGRDAELHARVLPLFEAQVQRLQDLKLISVEASLNLSLESLSLIHEVASASVRFQLQAAEDLCLQSKPSKANELLKRSAQTLSVILRDAWTKKPEAGMPPHYTEVLETLVSVFKRRLSISEASLPDQDIHSWVVLMEQSVSTLCGYSAPLSAGTMPDVYHLPIRSDWLSNARKAIALRAYNLAVSLNVARFSGWEDSEFRMELMRRRSNSSSYFGVTMSDGMVSGLLHQHEGDLFDQWDDLQLLVNKSTEVSLRRLLEERRSSSWYRDATESYEKSRRQNRIAAQGEDHGLFVLLTFSRACILSARKAETSDQKSKLVLNALSVLLPLLQFTLKAVVWDATMGIVSETRATVLDWRNSTTYDEKKEDGNSQWKRVRKRSVPFPKEETRDMVSLHSSFAGERASPLLSNLVVVRSESFLRIWTDNPVLEPLLTKASLNELSRSVWRGVQQLRLCHTAGAAELASLNVAVAMLDLVSHASCPNPFHCLHMASLFASQGPKLGSSDKPFRTSLPNKEDCNTLEALVILGRAECLQALHFCTEAAFLCDYVASVCHLRLSNGMSERPSRGRWNIVRAVAYNTSVSIRHTASFFVKDADKRNDSVVWKWRKEAIDVLLRGKEDCLRFIGVIRPPEGSFPLLSITGTAPDELLPHSLLNGTHDNPDKLPRSNESDSVPAVKDDDTNLVGSEIVGV